MVNIYSKKGKGNRTKRTDKQTIAFLRTCIEKSKLANQKKNAEIRFLRLQLEYIRNKLNLILDKEYYDGLKAFDFIGGDDESGV